jgi:hypothetical protein
LPDLGLHLGRHLGLRRIRQNETGYDRCGTDTKKHDGPYRQLVLFGSVSAEGRNDDSLGCRGDDRRAAIGESADTRQAGFRGTNDRGNSQHEGEGKDETEGSHLTVSSIRRRRFRRFVVGLITIGRFRSSAPKAENGFIAHKNCFVAAAG